MRERPWSPPRAPADRRILPPGPVAQPSVESLAAALYPADTEYLYFVARPDGRHEFSETYRQHINTIRRGR
jgi:UPF0755 protein